MLIEAGDVLLAQVKHLWTIANFSKVYRESKYIYLPSFAVTLNSAEWRFALLMRQHNRGKQQYVNVFIVRVTDGNAERDNELNVDIEFAVLGDRDQVVYEHKVAQNYSGSRVLVDLAIEEAIIFANERRLRKNELRLVWTITSDGYAAAATRARADWNGRIARLREFDQFGQLLNSEQFSDVTLRVDGADIRAHKNILACRSPVFRAMFTHPMKEARSNQVQITDVDYGTMRELLRYIYTGELGGDRDDGDDAFTKYSSVLMAAVKYCVQSLKARCERKLSLVLSADNVLDCLVLADMHDAVDLKRKAIDFIVAKAEQIVGLPSYEDFIALHADVSIDVKRALDAKKRRIN
ncbi:speckle-type POZ protein-like [Phymastichus coffea]|uniref:speckle-type POZ protein-like n=1 Tax=Phymastichus coffea TaxID=108790 RepID=UPI00273B1D34|nr:speckle-type POZ protein-like [Phymastichus coffea]